MKRPVRPKKVSAFEEHYDSVLLILSSAGLSVKDILHVSQTSHYLHDLIMNDKFWDNMFIDRFLMNKKNVTPKERSDFFETLKERKYELEEWGQWDRWNREKKWAKKPFVHYLAKAYEMDTNIMKSFRFKNNFISFKEKLIRELPGEDRFIFPKYGNREFFNEDEGMYVMTYTKGFGGFNDEDIENLSVILSGSVTVDYAYVLERQTNFHRLTVFIPENKFCRVIYKMLLYGYKSHADTPEGLKLCISCQFEQATLRDRITGLVYCSEACWNED